MKHARVIVTVACLAHMASVLLGGIPVRAGDVIPSPVDAPLKASDAYLSLTGQWQQWNLFSPSPPVIASRYFVRSQRGDGSWQMIRAITPQSFLPLSRSAELKYLRFLEDVRGKPALVEFGQGYLQDLCKGWNLPRGMKLQFLAHLRYVARDREIMENVRTMPPEEEMGMIAEGACENDE